jgi:flagellar protein FlaI
VASISLLLYLATFNAIYLLSSAFLAVSSTLYLLILRRRRLVVSAPAVKVPMEEAKYSLMDIVRLNEMCYVGFTEEAGVGVKYVVIEPKFDRQLYGRIREYLVEELKVGFDRIEGERERKEFLEKKVLDVVKRHRISVGDVDLKVLLYYFYRDFIGFGKIQPLMLDDKIEDISCDGPNIPVYIWHREYESIPTNVVFESPEELNSLIMKLAYKAGRHISISNPIVDASLPDGSRLHLTYSTEVTKKGSTFTIRKFRVEPLTVVDLINYGTISSEVAAYLWYTLERTFSILVVGGTASGKTTTLNALSIFIPQNLKIITIEDTPELLLPHKNWIQEISRPAFGGVGEITLFDLLKASLRQRPDIIIVGEVRGEEAYTLFQAMATGHGGFSTVHADSIEAAFSRLSTEPMNVPKSLIANALDIAILQLKLKMGQKYVRRVFNVSEIVSYDPETDKIVSNEVFKFDVRTGRYIFSEKSDVLEKIMETYGESRENILLELEKRRTILDWMCAKNIRSYKDVSSVIAEFYQSPNTVYERAKVELITRE